MKRRAHLEDKHRSAKAKSKSLKSRPSASSKVQRKARPKSNARSTSVSQKQVTKAKIRSTSTSTEALLPRVVRIMGRGQFKVNSKILRRLNQVDAAMVNLASKEKSDDVEFKKKLTELSEIVIKDGKPVPTKEIIKSDIILPSADLPIDEAKKLFTVQGVIPQF